MKKTFILFGTGFLFTALTSSAQVTINSSNVGNPGDVLIQAQDYNPDASITVGGSGAGQTWNFSSLNEDEVDTVRFLAKTGIPRAAEFPSATMVLTSSLEDSSWIFMNKSATELRLEGFVAVMDFFGVIDTISEAINQKILSFPSTLNTTFTDAGSSFEETDEFGIDPDGAGPHPFVDSLKVSYTGEITSTMDAEGTMQLPQGTFNALRQHTIDVSTTTLYMKAGGTWTIISATMEAFIGQDAVTKDTSESYRWWTDAIGAGFPLVEIDLYEGDIDGGVRYLKVTPTGIAKQALPQLSVYPNPTSGVLNVSLDNNGDSRHTFELYDAAGKKVNVAVINGYQQQLDLSNSANGIYFYHLLNSDGAPVAAGKINVQK